MRGASGGDLLRDNCLVESRADAREKYGSRLLVDARERNAPGSACGHKNNLQAQVDDDCPQTRPQTKKTLAEFVGEYCR